jgi:hypothetical protein
MAVFKSRRLFPYALRDLTPVARDVVEHFRKQEYEVSSQETITNGFDISITKGGIFKSVLGLKTALKISIEPANEMTKSQAGVGIFGQQAIPTAITLFVFWPVLITQIWGLVRSSKLDDEALNAIETSLKIHGRETDQSVPSLRDAAAEAVVATSPSVNAFCTECGAALPVSAKFCPGCGMAVV